MAFSVRTSKPSNNKYYIRQANGGYNGAIQGSPTDKNANVLANCVGYANGRFNEIGEYGKCKYQLVSNAENFIERAKEQGLQISQEPSVGAIMVWQKGTLSSSDGAGHVCIVEKVNNANSVYTSESAYGGSAFYNQTRTKGSGNWGAGSAYKFRGFIVNPAAPKPAPSPSPSDEWKRIPQNGTYYIQTNGLRVRRAPTMKGEVVAHYNNGGSVKYDSYVDNDGYRWVSYIGASGKRNYIARRSLDGKQVFGYCK